MNPTTPEQAGQPERRKLRWWFWLVLLAPVAVAPLIPEVVSFWVPSDQHDISNWILSAILYTLFLTDALCSIAASIILCRARTGRLAVVPVLVSACLFFVMNLILAFAGCAATAMTASAFSR